MPGKLTNFLSELAVSPEKLASYQKNPDAAMKKAGLDADEIAALKSGDPAKVHASLSGQSVSGGAAQPNAAGNCIWAAQPNAAGNCIWAAQPPANANCIWAAHPPANADCIWAAQPNAAAQPPANASCIWAAHPNAAANCIWAAQPQGGAPNCIWAAQPQANCIWAAQPCTIVVHHHFIHAAQPQANMQTPASPESNQPGSRSSKGKSTTGTTP